MSFPGRAVQRTWHLVDATSQTVGRLATTIAPILKGKHKPTYRPNGDCGDYVVIVNADKVLWLLSLFAVYYSFDELCINLLKIIHYYLLQLFRFIYRVKNGAIRYIDGTRATREG